MRLYILVAIFMAGLLSGGASGWKARSWKADSEDKARLEAEAEVKRLRARQVDDAAQWLEVKRAAAEIRWRTVTKEVEKVVEKPVYRSDCLDADGLRLIAEQVNARTSGQPAPAVPSASAP